MMPRIPVPANEAISISWDETACPLCGQHNAEQLLESPDNNPNLGPGRWFAVVRCRHCAMHYTNPRPSPQSIGSFYPSHYKPHHRSHERARTRMHSLWGRLTGRCYERRGEIPWDPPGRLLDFGCGAGSFLKRMADRGWDVTGVDASVTAVRQVEESLGLRAHVGSLPHPELEPGSFHVITMWHSLEHVHQPAAILREAYSLLVPGGKLLVACPNLNSWPYRWFGDAWFGLDLPRHLVHYTPETLRRTLLTSGFRVTSLRYIRHNDWLRSSAKLRLQRSGSSRLVRSLLWKPVAKAVAWFSYLRGQSDCMLAIAERPVNG